jgi:hypothetical protein
MIIDTTVAGKRSPSGHLAITNSRFSPSNTTL